MLDSDFYAQFIIFIDFEREQRGNSCGNVEQKGQTTEYSDVLLRLEQNISVVYVKK